MTTLVSLEEKSLMWDLSKLFNRGSRTRLVVKPFFFLSFGQYLKPDVPHAVLYDPTGVCHRR